jgi:ABC-type sulfate/molybdate transport systems ATPase subunit
VSGIEVRNLHKRPGGPLSAEVLSGVSFAAAAGVCTGLRGATGSGKTTLLRLIAGLDRPDRGEILLNDRVVDDGTVFVAPRERAIGFVFQSLGLWPHLTVDAHLEYVLAATPWPQEERERRKTEAFRAFSLTDLQDRRPAALSGGEKRLLALARALVGDARTLLLDEPFTGLDGQLKDQVIQALAGWLNRHQLTALLVSHDAEDLGKLCRETVQLRQGQACGPAESPKIGAGACAASRS